MQAFNSDCKHTIATFFLFTQNIVSDLVHCNFITLWGYNFMIGGCVPTWFSEMLLSLLGEKKEIFLRILVNYSYLHVMAKPWEMPQVFSFSFLIHFIFMYWNRPVSPVISSFYWLIEPQFALLSYVANPAVTYLIWENLQCSLVLGAFSCSNFWWTQ